MSELSLSAIPKPVRNITPLKASKSYDHNLDLNKQTDPKYRMSLVDEFRAHVPAVST